MRCNDPRPPVSWWSTPSYQICNSERYLNVCLDYWTECYRMTSGGWIRIISYAARPSKNCRYLIMKRRNTIYPIQCPRCWWSPYPIYSSQSTLTSPLFEADCESTETNESRTNSHHQRNSPPNRTSIKVLIGLSLSHWRRPKSNVGSILSTNILKVIQIQVPKWLHYFL